MTGTSGVALFAEHDLRKRSTPHVPERLGFIVKQNAPGEAPRASYRSAGIGIGQGLRPGRRLTIRSKRLATLAIFEDSLLTKLVYNEVTLPTRKRLSSSVRLPRVGCEEVLARWVRRPRPSLASLWGGQGQL